MHPFKSFLFGASSEKPLSISQSIGQAVQSTTTFHDKIQKANALPILQEKQKTLQDINAKVMDTQKLIEVLQEQSTDIEAEIKLLNEEIPQLKDKLKEIDYTYVGSVISLVYNTNAHKNEVLQLKAQIKEKEEQLQKLNLGSSEIKTINLDYGLAEKSITSALLETRVCLEELDKKIESSLELMDSSAICSGMSKKEKVGVILKGDGFIEEVLKYGKQCIDPEMEPSEKVEILEAIQALLPQLTDPFLLKLEESKNDKILPTLINFPKKSDYFASFVREHSDELEVIDFLKISNFKFVEALSKIPEDENMEDLLEEVININLDTGMFKTNIIKLIDCLVKIPKKERSDLIDLAWKTSTLQCLGGSNVTADDFTNQMEYLFELPDYEREEYADVLHHSFMIDSSMNPEVIKGIRQIPMSERSSIVGAFPGMQFMKKISGDADPIFLFYLIPNDLREKLSKLEGPIFKNIDLRKSLISSCLDKFINIENLSEETLDALLHFIKDNEEGLRSDEDYELLYSGVKNFEPMLNGESNPFEIVKRINSSKELFSKDEYVQKLFNQGKQLMSKRMSQADKVKIMWGLMTLNADENSKEILLLKKVPEGNRANALSVMLQCVKIKEEIFQEELETGVDIIQKLSVFKEQLSTKSLSKLNTLEGWVLGDYQLVKAMTAFPQDQMVQILSFIMSFPLDRESLAPLLEQLIQIPHQERLEILELAKEVTLAQGVNDLGGIQEQVYIMLELDPEDRLDYVDACKHAYKLENTQNLKLNTDHQIIMNGFLQIPEKHRKIVSKFISSYSKLKQVAEDLNPIFTLYLLPKYSKVEKFSKLTREKLDILLQDPCLKIIQNLQDFPENTVRGALDILNQLNDVDEGVSEWCIFVTTILEGDKNPYKIERKLKKQLLEPVTFQPIPIRIDNKTVTYDMKKLKKISQSTDIQREDLPKEATLEAFNEIFHSFDMHKENPQLLYEKIGDILPPEASIHLTANELQKKKINAGTIIWSGIDITVTKDSQKLLTKLLNQTGPVKEIEAKWRMVVKHMLNQKDDVKEGQFFSDRQESFLRIMSGIVNCEAGKEQGIHAAYSYLEPEERGKGNFSTAIKSVQEIAEGEDRENALTFVRDFLDPTTDNVSRLVEYAKNNTKESAGMLMHLVPYDEKFYDTEDYIVFTLNSEGAKEIIKVMDKEQSREKVLGFVNQSIQLFMDKYITGISDEVMKDLTETKVVSEPAHQKKYLRNLIGSFVGLSEEIAFDKYTGVLNDHFLNLPRDQVFEIFFQHASVADLVKALTRDINEDIAKNNQTLALFKAFLPEKEFWNKYDDTKIDLKGVVELLLQTALRET